MPVNRETVDSWYPTVQRYALLFFGLVGVGYETVVDRLHDRPYLLVLFGGMLGLGEIAHAWRKGDD
jgi:hypothetical protein